MSVFDVRCRWQVEFSDAEFVLMSRKNSDLTSSFELLKVDLADISRRAI
jgi:hypothetical protein